MRPLDTRAAGPQLASPRRRTPAGPSSLATSRVVRAGDRPVPRSAQPRPAWGARAVGSLVPRVTRSAFEKFGFSTATLITEWATIVGPDLARLTAPERVKWPRLAERAPDEGRWRADLRVREDRAP